MHAGMMNQCILEWSGSGDYNLFKTTSTGSL